MSLTCLKHLKENSGENGRNTGPVSIAASQNKNKAIIRSDKSTSFYPLKPLLSFKKTNKNVINQRHSRQELFYIQTAIKMIKNLNIF